MQNACDAVISITARKYIFIEMSFIHKWVLQKQSKAKQIGYFCTGTEIVEELHCTMHCHNSHRIVVWLCFVLALDREDTSRF